jgi:hypothetical protein
MAVTVIDSKSFSSKSDMSASHKNLLVRLIRRSSEWFDEFIYTCSLFVD